MKLVARLLPFHSTVDVLTKFHPETVSINGLPPAAALDGDSPVTAGTAIELD